MHKNKSCLERDIRLILSKLIKTKDLISGIGEEQDLNYATYICCERKYIENLNHSKVASGDYIFQKCGNMRVSEKGLEFLRDTSLIIKIRDSIFKLLKGTIGFLLGVLSTVMARYIIDLLGLS